MKTLYNFLKAKVCTIQVIWKSRLWQTFNNSVQKTQSLEIKGFMVKYIQSSDKITPFVGTKGILFNA